MTLDMSYSTPKKRKIRDVVEDALPDETSSPEHEAIDWREDELVLGPTPQLHGRIIGLFDTLSPARPDALVMPAPVSVQKQLPSPLKTPAYLKQVCINLDESKPRLLFNLPKRGLSVLINELREMEDQEEDEGLAVLREMEAEFPRMSEDAQENRETAQGPREQAAEKVKWKKKGLKRAHRRVIMRPTTKKKTDDQTINDNAEEDDEDEYIHSDEEAADAEAALNPPARPSSVSASASTKKATDKPARAKKAGGISHNYKSLKLRNSGAKGGNRFGRGKFGGRR